VQTRRGIVAADPDVIPIGSRIRVHNAGQYSGEYAVEDTGRKINGNIIDIYMPNSREARQFGRRQVHVEILETAEAKRD
jgi:3D (Asp-Asp-Asp) domain-containing protein